MIVKIIPHCGIKSTVEPLTVERVQVLVQLIKLADMQVIQITKDQLYKDQIVFSINVASITGKTKMKNLIRSLSYFNWLVLALSLEHPSPQINTYNLRLENVSD